MAFNARRILAFLLMMLALAAHAEDNLVTVQVKSVTGPPGGMQELLAVDGRAVALNGREAQVFDAEHGQWQPAGGTDIDVAASAQREHDTIVAGADGRVARLALHRGGLEASPLPALPAGLRAPQLAALGDTLYVAATGPDQSFQLFALALDQPRAAWQPMAHPAAQAAAVTSLAAQNAALVATLRSAAGDRVLRWRAKDKAWAELPPLPGSVIAGAVKATGQAHVLYLLRPLDGGAPQLWSFHTITGAWAHQHAQLPRELGAITGLNNGMLWDSAGQLQSLQLVTGKRLLKWVDWVVIIGYLAGMLGIGWYFYAREKRHSTADFFVGGRKIPFWAAGISLYAANTSSISYIAIPAKAFETNWQYMTNNLIAAVALVFVAIAIVPLLRRLNLMSVFHYLEIRFHPAIRMLASLICILVQIGSRMSVILLLPSLAIATITGIDVTWSILLMGGFTIVYTAMGGMKAVVWTDFVQLIVKMGGVIFALGYVVLKLKGGLPELVQVAQAEHKAKLLDFSWDLTQPTVWGFIFLVIFDVILTFPKDQVLMQRALSTKSAAESTRSILTFSAISIPFGFLFYGVGTALYAFYKAHPERMDPVLNVDATFPLFIAAELPTGVTGLIIAGILAAAMATLSGIMNSVATLASVDFYEKLKKDRTPRQSVVFAELATVATGLVGIVAALWLSRINAHSLFDVSIELAGLLGGGFAGAYTLGMFTRRANWQGVVCGIAGSTLLTTAAWAMKLVHPYFYLPISIMLCICIGYVASWLFPAPTQDLAGLTIYKD
ncbi:MAG: sodium:solute symporter [Telluria sp.]